MKIRQFREMAPGELQGKLDELQKHLFSMRSQAVTEKLENCRVVINTRRDIARIKTLIREQQMQSAQA